MRIKDSASSQKKRGGYYTPTELSDFIIKLVYNNQKKILEPSCGDGVFIKSMLNNTDNNYERLDAVEYIKEEANKTKRIANKQEKIKVINDDFYNFYMNTDDYYDLIIGNPPYIRYQYLSDEQRKRQSEVLKKNNMTPNKLINSWVFFLVSCVELLSQDGKIALVLPAELLQVVYAKELREFLVNHLKKILIFSFDELIFDEAEQEVIVLVGEKKSEMNQECLIANYSYANLNDLIENFSENASKYNRINLLSEKWTRYYLSEEQNNLLSEIENNKKFRKFGEVALINVGITTGNNDYFSVNKETMKKYNLEKFSVPLIGRSSHAYSIFFDEKDWKKNVDNGVNSYLLCIDDNVNYNDFNKKQKEYIDFGLSNKVQEGYKCSIRNKWYSIPSVWKPNAFFLRRTNIYPKFVINEIDAVSTDTMHRINFYDGYDGYKILLSYYNSITFAFVELNGRSYGGGVLELLPSEVSKIFIPNIDNVSEDKINKLLKIVNDYVENNKEIEGLLDIIDEEILVQELKISKVKIKKFRNIWKFYLNRRRNRGKKVNKNDCKTSS